MQGKKVSIFIFDSLSVNVFFSLMTKNNDFYSLLHYIPEPVDSHFYIFFLHGYPYVYISTELFYNLSVTVKGDRRPSPSYGPTHASKPPGASAGPDAL